MAVAVIMPRQGQSVESCVISRWHKKVGDDVAVGEILFTYETDKATFDETAKNAGKLLGILFEEGDDVPCLINVCIIGAEGEDISEFKTGGDDAGAAVDIAAEENSLKPDDIAVETKTEPVINENTAPGGFVRISPRAKNYAAKNNVDYRAAEGTGAMSRIMERDIEKLIREGKNVYTHAASTQMTDFTVPGTGIGGRVTTEDVSNGFTGQFQQALTKALGSLETSDLSVSGVEAEYEETALSNVRKTIARAMSSSLAEIPQLTLNASFDASAIMSFRATLKASGEAMELENITLNDIILYACSKTLLSHRALNATLNGSVVRYYNHVHLCVAVDTPRGLLVPKIPRAETLSLNDIASCAKKIVKDAQSGSIDPGLLSGGTFTVTNLGTLGVESFTPVINPPQTAILGVCSITQRVRQGGGGIEMYPAMGLSLTFDHRAVDGAPAARFLKELCFNLENFSLLLAK